MIVLYIVLAIIVILLLVVLIRTAMFKPKKKEYPDLGEVEIDLEKSTKSLAELIKCKTVSSYNPEEEDDKEFRKLLDMLPTLYPNVFKTCSYQELANRGILFKWDGKEAKGNPAILMAHYDVVPVERENWERDPFGAEIIDNVMWGRGTLDTKVTFNGVLSAADQLIAKGFQPVNDIYFAFSGNEEVNGMGAVNIKNWFKERGITPELVVDEGGAVVENMFPGVKQPTGLIGIAEKGMINLELTLKSNGGHASAPGPHTPVGELALAACKMEANPFKAHFTKPVLAMFDTLGRESTFVYKMIFANLWLFKGILDGICKKSGGELNALVRTTVALTMMEGSSAPNVIPPEAKITANLRLNPEDNINSAMEYVKSVIKNDEIKLSTYASMEPSRISEIDCKGWNIVESSVASTWKGCIVAPYLMVQCSDSRHYSDISDRVYRFSAMDLTVDERHSIHGNNEKIRIETIGKAVEFFTRVMKQC